LKLLKLFNVVAS